MVQWTPLRMARLGGIGMINKDDIERMIAMVDEIKAMLLKPKIDDPIFFSALDSKCYQLYMEINPWF